MLYEIGQLELRHARLPCAEQFTGPAQPQVLFGNYKSVLRFPHDFQPRPRRFAERLLVKQQTTRTRSAAPDPAAQLV